LIWLILVLGLILRSISLNQSLWLDEAINVVALTQYSFLGMITEYAKADFHPPLFFIVLWVWTKIFGISEILVRIPSVIFGVTTIYMIYLTGKKIYSEKLGLIAGFLLSINPLHIYYSQEARMYALATLAVSINIFFLVKLLKKEKVNSFFLVASNLAVLASDYVAWLVFPAQFIFLVFFNKNLIKKWSITFLLAVLAGAFWIPTFISQLSVGAVASSRLPTWKFVVGGFDLKTVPLTFVKFIIGRISYPDKTIYGLMLLPLIVIFSSLIFRGFRYIKNWERNLLSCWLVIPIILATIISLYIPIYSYFRILFVLPSFLILTGLGVLSLPYKFKYLSLIIVAAIEIFSSFVYLFNPAYQREDWRGVVSYLKAKKENNLILFESSGTLAPFDYYAKNTVNAKGALKDFPAKDENDVLSIPNDQPDIYLVDYLVDISDPKRLVSQKLINLGYELVGTNDFHGVGFIYHYQKIL